MTKELEPCPFCGGEAMLCENLDYSYVYCMRCGCQTNEVGDILDAVDLWNTRYKRICHIVVKPSDSDYSDEWHFMCSECGCPIDVCEIETDIDGKPIPIRHASFCSNCGAEVIE